MCNHINFVTIFAVVFNYTKFIVTAILTKTLFYITAFAILAICAIQLDFYCNLCNKIGIGFLTDCKDCQIFCNLFSDCENSSNPNKDWEAQSQLIANENLQSQSIAN